QNLQRMASAMPGSGVAGLRRHEWSVEAQPGGGRPEKPRPHPGAAARPVRRLHRVGQLVAAAEDKATAARRSLRRADVRAVAAEAAVAQRLQKGNRRPGLYARLRRLQTAPTWSSSTARWAPKKQSTPWQRLPPRRSPPSARSSTR